MVLIFINSSQISFSEKVLSNSLRNLTDSPNKSKNRR